MNIYTCYMLLTAVPSQPFIFHVSKILSIQTYNSIHMEKETDFSACLQAVSLSCSAASFCKFRILVMVNYEVI